MATLTAPELIHAIANVLRSSEIDGLEGVSYPMTSTFPRSPWLMVRASQQFPASYVQGRLGEQIVTQPVDLIVLIKATSDEVASQSRLDPIIERVLDALDVTATGVHPSTLLGLEGHQIDHVRTEAQVTRRPVDWSGTPCYAAYISIDPQYRRKANRIARKETI